MSTKQLALLASVVLATAAAGPALRASAAVNAESSAGKVPSWCKFVPGAFKSKACSGGDSEDGPSESCACKDYCSSTPSLSWSLNPECCGCTRDDDGSSKSGGGDDTNSSQPSWCRYVPEAYKSEACNSRDSEEGGCGCRDWCSSTPSVSQQYIPYCCGCQGNGTASGSPADEPQSDNTTDSDVPVWCRYVPEAYKKEACSGGSDHSGCSCHSWCSATPSVSQRYIPQCCGCDGNQGGTDNATDSEGGSQGSDQGQQPIWCRYVPDAYKQDACGGSSRDSNGTCACHDWCSSTPSVSQPYIPQCCGCSGTGDSDSTPPSIDERQGSAKNQPSWCEFVPDKYKAQACGSGGKDGGSSCQCHDWCESTPQISQQYIPQCCGCGGESGRSSGSSSGNNKANDWQGGSEFSAAPRAVSGVAMWGALVLLLSM